MSLLPSKSANPLDNFCIHGIVNPESAEDYTYVLLVDESGQALIKRVSSDQKHIRFALMPHPAHFALIQPAIDAFWAAYNDPSLVYVYLYQL